MTTASKIPAQYLGVKVTEIDEEMSWGRRPAHLYALVSVLRNLLDFNCSKRTVRDDSTPNLILSHGYCAAANPFAAKASVCFSYVGDLCVCS